MQVFVNGVLHPTAFSSIPGNVLETEGETETDRERASARERARETSRDRANTHITRTHTHAHTHTHTHTHTHVNYGIRCRLGTTNGIPRHPSTVSPVLQAPIP
jgi:hypothetical protein